MDDYEKINPSMIMKNGGLNDVYGAVFQCLACMSSFTKFFMNEDYKEVIDDTIYNKLNNKMVDRVFSLLWGR